MTASVVMQQVQAQAVAPHPSWVWLAFALAFIGTPYLMLAVFLRKSWGIKGLVGLGAVVAATLLWIVLSDRSAPNGVAVWGATTIMFIGFVAAPLTAIELVGRAPSPPRFWSQVGLGFASMIGGLIASALIAALSIVVAAHMHIHL